MAQRTLSLLSRCKITKPIARNVFYGTLVFLCMYAVFYMTASEETQQALFPMRPRPPVSTDSGAEGKGRTVWPPKEGWPPKIPSVGEMKKTTTKRAERVRAAFRHAYGGYERYAMPFDELLPLTMGKVNNFNGWGVTVIDSLDTMLLMGLEDEYKRGLEVVRKADFTKATEGYAPYFETIIRYLGGLLSAYALSSPKDTILLERAEELVKLLDPVFDSPTGLPFYSVDPSNGKHYGPDTGILAEVGTLQLEYSYLAKLTGKFEHFNRSDTVMKLFESANLKATGGMLPVRWHMTTGEPYDAQLSVGAAADSAHEYLLKLYLLTGKTDKGSLELYLRTTTQIITQLLYLSPTRHLLYVTDTRKPHNPSHRLEHLSCFLPGLLVLGASALPLDNLPSLDIGLRTLTDLGNETTYEGSAGSAYTALKGYNLKDLHMWAAEGLATTCYLTYADQPTGLGPDEVVMDTIYHGTKKHADKGEGESTYLWMNAVEKWKKSGGRGSVPGLGEKKPIVYTDTEGKGRDYSIRNWDYLLRPETVESLYMMWRVTGNEIWRERGWKIFEAIERETKTQSGFASIYRVDQTPASAKDSMPSYFLAETLKYLYLMFLDKDPIELDKWVFNTEAHPLPVFQWTEEEKKRFSIV